MKKIIYPCLILLFACNTPRQKGLVYYNDFESIKGWAPLALSKKTAHSGIYSNKLDTAHAFGVTFKQLFRELSDDKLVKVKVSFWTYMTPNADGKLVVQVNKLDNSLALWTAKNLADIAPKRGQWQQAEAQFTFPADSINKPDNTISIYPWSTGKGDFYIDDMKIEFVHGY
jgi:hypothetical protein